MIKLKKEREKHGKQISMSLMLVRQTRSAEMIRWWRTIEELVTVQANTKIVLNNKRKIWPKEWARHPEIYARRKEWHHETVSWKLALNRVYRWWDIEQAMRISKGG